MFVARSLPALLCACALLLAGCAADPESSVAVGGTTVDEAAFAELESEIAERFAGVRQLSTAALAQRLAEETEPPLLLDVRAAEEFAVSHLPGAVRAEHAGEALQHLEGSPAEREIVVYCSVGYRSSALAEELAAAGYTNVANLAGSIFRWANEGRNLETDQSSTQSVHPYDSSWGRFLERSRWSFGDE